MKMIKCFCTVAILLVSFTLFAQENLGYKLQKGDQFKVSQDAVQDIVQDMNGSKHEMKNELSAEYFFVVTNVSDSLYTIDFKFDSFKMVSTSNLMGELISVNTKDSIAADDIEGKIFSGLTKSTLTMEMYKNGKIKQVLGSDALVENMVNGAGDFDDFTKELMKESMNKEFGDGSLSSSFEQMTYIYPNDEVHIGDSWKNVFSGDLASDNTWTYKAKDDNGINITALSDVVFKTEEETITMSLKGTMDANLTADATSGFIKEMTTSTKAEGISVLKQMNNTEVPTTIISNITYKAERYVQ